MQKPTGARFAALPAVFSFLLLSLSFALGQASSTTGSSLAKDYGKLPLSFEANQGQVDPEVRFLSRGSGYSLFLTDKAAVLSLRRPDALSATPAAKAGSPASFGPKPAASFKTDVMRMELAGASRDLQVSGDSPLPGTANYSIGNDPTKWHTSVPTYARVKYNHVYPGINLVYYGNQSRLEYDFVVAPGADPKQIRLHFSGASKLKLNADGDLEVVAKNGQIALRKPVVYQLNGDTSEPIAAKFTLSAKRAVEFSLGKHDPSRPVVIDPVLSYSTYLGGSGGGFAHYYGDGARAIAIDTLGYAYITGFTYSADFPVTTDVPQSVNRELANGAPAAFVSKLSPDGTALVHSTFLGGNGGGYSGQGDIGNAIAVASNGQAYVIGSTYSKNFPVTAGAFQTVNNGFALDNSNAFVAALSASGDALVYSTYLGEAENTLGTRMRAVM